MQRLRVIALIAIYGAVASAFAQTSATPADAAAGPAELAGTQAASLAAPIPIAVAAAPMESAPAAAGPSVPANSANAPMDPAPPAVGTAAPADVGAARAESSPDVEGPPAPGGLAAGPAESAPIAIEPPAPEGLSDQAYATVWERIRAGFKMPEIDDPLVRKWEEFYVARPEYWQRIIERGKRYLYFITEEIERRDMPLEIALLPIIESAYNPEAMSSARAAGIWQFIPATGKSYGLQQNWWLDNRRDVTVATGSALDYLENLHGMFGDWQLALASYNWGEGSVQRAINRNRALGKPTDYASLNVPTETRNYLPKLQAVKNLIMTPEKFGISLADVPDQPYFATVTTQRHIDVALAARLAEMPVDEFRRLNPAHNRPVMAGEGEQRIMLPYDKAESFAIRLDAYALPLVSWRPYQIKSGERLDQVAPRFGIGIDELRRVNGLTIKKRIVPGYTLLVPARSGETAAERIPTAIFRDAPDGGPGWHRVRRGETLVTIAHRYGISPADLKMLNGLSGISVAIGHALRLHDGVSASAGKPRATGKSKVAKRGVKKPAAKATRRR